MKGVLIRAERITPELLVAWKAKGANAIVVPLDERTKERWGGVSKSAEDAGLTLWLWIEVARNPAMADAHPEWMATIGVHHDDWRRRFPKAPQTQPGEVIKAWPWVPIGYTPALESHRARLKTLLADLPGAWSGAFLNDLQAGPSSCGCGNDQCRWALDYGAPPTAERAPGDDVAARLVAELGDRHPRKTIVPVWVTECENIDLPGAKGGTGLCGGVPCAKGDCWPRYVRSWNPLLGASRRPVAVALWSETFQRDPSSWPSVALGLFQSPPRDGLAVRPERVIAVLQAWNKQGQELDIALERVRKRPEGWVLALDPVEQSWEPRVVRVPAASKKEH